MTIATNLEILIFFIFLIKNSFAGLVVGENGQGQYTKNSDHMNGDLPSLFQQDLNGDPSDLFNDDTKLENNDPNHQELIKPKFQLLTEWDCTDAGSECREQLKNFLKKLNQVRRREVLSNPQICDEDFHILHVGKAIRMSLHGTVNTFNIIADNLCDEIMRCNMYGFFDEFGTMTKFDYDCIPDVNAMKARNDMREKIEKQKIEAAKAKVENKEKVKMLMDNSRLSGWSFLENHRHL